MQAEASSRAGSPSGSIGSKAECDDVVDCLAEASMSKGLFAACEHSTELQSTNWSSQTPV